MQQRCGRKDGLSATHTLLETVAQALASVVQCKMQMPDRAECRFRSHAGIMQAGMYTVTVHNGQIRKSEALAASPRQPRQHRHVMSRILTKEFGNRLMPFL